MRRGTTFVLFVILAFVATACGEEAAREPGGATGELGETTLSECVIDKGDTPAAEGTGAPIKTLKTGKLVVGSDTAFPPFESIENGKAVGFDIDLITEVAKRIGNLEVEVQTSAFDTIFTSLAARKFDVVISAVTIKAERKQTVDFSAPYFAADLSLTVRDDDAEEISGIDDLSGETVGVQATTTSEDCAKALKDKGQIGDIRAYDVIPDAFTDLSAGRVAGVMIDLPTAQQIAEQRTGLRVVQVIRTEEEYGIAVSKENPDLRSAINKALADIKEDGTYRRLFVKWLKTEPPA